MDFLHHLQNAGVEIINSPRTIEISVDKYRSLNLIVDAGVPIPQTRVAESLSSALACFDALGRDVVYKPIFGSMGRGIRRLTHHSSARTFFETQIGEGQIIYLQTFIDHGDWDIRILILGDQTFAIRRHRKGHWLTNLSQGAIATPHQASDQELAVAFAAAQAIDCQVAGVDLFYDTQTGRLMVCDVNAAPGWKGTAAALGVDLGAAMLEFICGTDKPNQSN
jgi:RimK family alpha-L-glutamate ligase